MSRLKELNETLFHQPAQPRFIDVTDATIRARQLQGEVLAQLIRDGSAALAKSVSQVLAAPARVHNRRRTVKQLKGLSDHCLKDIGVERGEIETLADRLATESMPARPSLIEKLRRSRARHAAIRELQRLPDRVLADIGLPRGMIAPAVDGLFSTKDGKMLEQPVVTRSAIRDILSRVMTEAPYLPMAEDAKDKAAHLSHGIMSKLSHLKGERTLADNENEPHAGVA